MLALAVAACGGSTGPSTPPTLKIACTSAPVTALAAVGDFAILNANLDGGCVRLPLAGAGGAEHLLIALSASKTNDWAEGYNFRGKTPSAAAAPQPMASLPSPRLAAFSRPLNSVEFHQMLRAQEHVLAASPAAHIGRTSRLVAPAPPVVGGQRSFWVCATSSCSGFVSVTATAKYVGTGGAIYLDNAAPANGYTQQEIDTLGALFDSTAVPAVPNMYAIDTAAFGRESDLDGNGVVIILLTAALNKLSPNCNATGRVILGYFFGLDLVTDPHSNNGEVFYSLVPDSTSAATTNCSIPKSFAKTELPPTFIHEFQHMISWNQHVTSHPGSVNDEDTWLNEGLSHFAQELGGRELPDDHRFGGVFGNGTPMDRLTQFALGNFDDANTYLSNPEANFLVYNAGGGSLAQRGAGWLFVRWLADQFGTDVLGNGLTQPLVQTTLRGAANVESATGTTFDSLVTEWQMANYLENVTGFAPSSPRLLYPSWNFQTNFVNLFGAYPLVPDVTSGAYGHSALLRSGSGRHVRVVQGANAASVDFQLSTQAGNPLSATTVGRIGVVRIQ